MKQVAINDVVDSIEPGDQFEVVFGGNASTSAAADLLRMNNNHVAELTQPFAQGILWAVSSSGSWESRQNRTYPLIAGTHWNPDRFMHIIGKALESIKVTSQAPRETDMHESEVIEMLQLAGQGDCVKIRLKNYSAKDVAWVPINMARQEKIQLLDDSEARLVRIQAEPQYVNADLRTFSCKVLTNLEHLIPFASWIGHVQELDSQIYMGENEPDEAGASITTAAEAR